MRRKTRGSAVVEAALMMPWLAFLFVGVLDFGFYAYAAICTQNAARAAAMAVATGSPVSACTAADGELAGLPNMIGQSSCGAQYPSGISASQPASACTTTVSASGAADTNCSQAASCADCGGNGGTTCTGTCQSIQATVAYQTIPMIPIPGVLMGKMTLTRSAEMKVIQ